MGRIQSTGQIWSFGLGIWSLFLCFWFLFIRLSGFGLMTLPPFALALLIWMAIMFFLNNKTA